MTALFPQVRVCVLLWPFLLHLSSSSTQSLFQCDVVLDGAGGDGEGGGRFSFPLPSRVRPASADTTASTSSMQCVYTFIAQQGQRVKLQFEQFLLAGTSEDCHSEYIDLYSELENANDNLLTASLGGRYCGSISPHIRISLHNIMVLVFHSRVNDSLSSKEEGIRFSGRYSFIPDSLFIPGLPHPKSSKCSFLITSAQSESGKGTIYSPTYPGTYPRNNHCAYTLKGEEGERIRIVFRDFDVFFGGEHCPYDAVTIYDGSSTSAPIVKKVCGLQQKMELYSFGHEFLIHFNTTSPPQIDPRGFVMEYEFSSRFVQLHALVGEERNGVSHVRGTECDVRVESNKETTHFIHSPNYPNTYPSNITCTYILDGLQGDERLEKVYVDFIHFAVKGGEALQQTAQDSITCPNAVVGVAIQENNMKTTMSSKDDNQYDFSLCDENMLDNQTFVSEGARMVVQFVSTDVPSHAAPHQGFSARVAFKTDYGIPGRQSKDSNICHFTYGQERKGIPRTGTFNSPRYPNNYPKNINCTYDIIGHEKEQILIFFEQFSLYRDDKTMLEANTEENAALNEERNCDDYVDIHDMLDLEGKQLTLLQHICAGKMGIPGPMISSFGVHRMRLFFHSHASASSYGFRAHYTIRRAPTHAIPEGKGDSDDGDGNCGERILASPTLTHGTITSPRDREGKHYPPGLRCKWEVVAREGYQILLRLQDMNVEGNPEKEGCSNAVLRVWEEGEKMKELCGVEKAKFPPLVTRSHTLHISFITATGKLNEMTGFVFTWIEVQRSEGEEKLANCSDDVHWYMCTKGYMCIPQALKCNGEKDCLGLNTDVDASDENSCSPHEEDADLTIIVAVVSSAAIFAFIFFFFCYLFKKKLERRKKKKRRQAKSKEEKGGSLRRNRQPYRGPAHKRTDPPPAMVEEEAACRLSHHDGRDVAAASALVPSHTFYG